MNFLSYHNIGIFNQMIGIEYLVSKLDLCKTECDMNNILERYQIRIISCMDEKYIRNFFRSNEIGIAQMAYRILNGQNCEEYSLNILNNSILDKIKVFSK